MQVASSIPYISNNLAWLLTMHRLWALFTLLVVIADAASKRHGHGPSHGHCHGHGHESQHLSVYEARNHVGSADEYTTSCLGLTENGSCIVADGSRASYCENSAQTDVLDHKPVSEQRNAYGAADKIQHPERSTASSNHIADDDRPSTLSRSPLPIANRIVETEPTPSQFPSEPTFDAYSVTNFFPYSPSGSDRPTAQSLPASRNLEYRADKLPSPYATLQQRAEDPTPYHNVLPRSVNVTLPSSTSTTVQQSSHATLPTLAPTETSKNRTSPASKTLKSQEPQNTDDATPSHGAPFQQDPNAASEKRVVPGTAFLRQPALWLRALGLGVVGSIPTASIVRFFCFVGRPYAMR
ncbi:hypothetical protein BST61_g2265 [Cercospora zeina]